MQILITNEQKTIKLNTKKIEALIRQILKILRLPQKSSLGITFLSRVKIRQLNRRYLRRNRATDVIAFGYKEALIPARIKKAVYTKRDNRVVRRMHPASRQIGEVYQDYLGDILICPGEALENSKMYHNDFFSELTLCIIHGILHLQGYTDATKHKKLKMQKVQEEVLRKVKGVP